MKNVRRNTRPFSCTTREALAFTPYQGVELCLFFVISQSDEGHGDIRT